MTDLDDYYVIRLSRKDLKMQVTVNPAYGENNILGIEYILKEAFAGALGHFLDEEERREESKPEG